MHEGYATRRQSTPSDNDKSAHQPLTVRSTSHADTRKLRHMFTCLMKYLLIYGLTSSTGINGHDNRQAPFGRLAS
jgi:hypothetical protein